jgi:hypothetical protein
MGNRLERGRTGSASVRFFIFGRNGRPGRARLQQRLVGPPRAARAARRRRSGARVQPGRDSHVHRTRCVSRRTTVRHRLTMGKLRLRQHAIARLRRSLPRWVGRLGRPGERQRWQSHRRHGWISRRLCGSRRRFRRSSERRRNLRIDRRLERSASRRRLRYVRPVFCARKRAKSSPADRCTSDSAAGRDPKGF